MIEIVNISSPNTIIIKVNMACGLVLINMRKKSSIRCSHQSSSPGYWESTFRHHQGKGNDTWQHMISLDHFYGTMISLYNSERNNN